MPLQLRMVQVDLIHYIRLVFLLATTTQNLRYNLRSLSFQPSREVLTVVHPNLKPVFVTVFRQHYLTLHAPLVYSPNFTYHFNHAVNNIYKPFIS